MSTIRKLDPTHRQERNRRREFLAQVMAASPHTRLGATAPVLSKIYRSPALSGAQKSERFSNIARWANGKRNENFTLKVRP